jgi:hypothetical protein
LLDALFLFSASFVWIPGFLVKTMVQVESVPNNTVHSKVMICRISTGNELDLRLSSIVDCGQVVISTN